MKLSITKEAEDERGKIMFLSFGDKNFNIVETKKGYARGGHYHDFTSYHFLISGTIEYREKNTDDNKEQIKKIKAPEIIKTPPNFAHLIIAIDDSVFIEIFDQAYQATNFEEYRKIVDEKLQK